MKITPSNSAISLLRKLRARKNSKKYRNNENINWTKVRPSDFHKPQNQTTQERPHKKPYLTTPFGRLVDRISFLWLWSITAVVVGLATLFFIFAEPEDSLSLNGAITNEPQDTLYFTLVTLTSLGYGDYLPHGAGRAVSIVVVICGLTLISLIIGKIASERQATTLYLLHTSDCERRIRQFSLELRTLNSTAQQEYKNHSRHEFKKTNKEMLACLIAMTQYVIFNANQAQLANSNFSSFNQLYLELSKISRFYANIFVLDLGVSESQRSFDIIARILGFSNLMIKFHENSTTPKKAWLFKLKDPETDLSIDRAKNIIKTLKKISTENLNFINAAHKKSSFWIIEKTYKLTPSGPINLWPHQLHKTIASQLNISNSLAQNCINELISRGRIPK